MSGSKPSPVTAYIDAAPPEAQDHLRAIRACLQDAAPNASESIKWGIPALSYDWILFTFAARKHHIGLYPHPRTIEAFADELEGLDHSSSTIRFPLDDELPLDLIRRIAEHRVMDATENGVKWM